MNVIPDYRKTILRWQLPHTGPLDQQLLEWGQVDTVHLYELIELGSVYCNETRILGLEKAALSFEKGSFIRIHSEPRRCPLDNIDWSQRLIYENSNYLVLDKPAGLPTHPMVDNWKENALIQVELYLQTKLFITHRLDRATEGLLIIAKNIEFQRLFNQVLQDQKTEKYYRAKVDRSLPPHTPRLLEHWMFRSNRAPKKIVSTLELYSLNQFDRCCLEILEENQKLLKLKLHTGRTHQIRAQLSFLGSPIFGDSLYGSDSDYLIEKICLQAAEMKFTDPLSLEKVQLSLPEPTWFSS